MQTPRAEYIPWMSNAPTLPSTPFNAAHAEVYDRQFERIQAIKDALHLLLAVQLRRLPEEARILVAGAGTGAETRHLASLHPGWRFTLADPSEAMLAVARRHIEREGFATRCTLHAGFVGTLPLEPHDAATSLLVSQFLTDASARQAFFEDIAARVRPGGILFVADLAADRASATFEGELSLWIDLLAFARDASPEASASYRAAFGRDFAVHSPAEVQAMIERAGFSAPTPCYQAGLIRGWVTTRR